MKRRWTAEAVYLDQPVSWGARHRTPLGALAEVYRANREARYLTFAVRYRIRRVAS